MAEQYSPIQPYNPSNTQNQAVPNATSANQNTNPNYQNVGGMIQNQNTNQSYTSNQLGQPISNQTYAQPQVAVTETEYYEESKKSPVTIVVERVRENPLLAGIIGVVFLALIIFGILLMTLGGGSESTDTPDGTVTPTDNSAVFIQWWGMFLDEETVQPLIDQYESLNPNVTIDYANKRTAGARENALISYQNELNRVFTSNDPAQQPDIFMVANTWAGDYEPYSSPNNLFTLESYAETYYTSALVDHAFSGQIYGVPAWMDTYAIIYNKDILASKAFSEPPTTWPEFKNLAKSLSTEELGGFGTGYSVNTDFSADLYLLLMLQNGVDITNSEGLVNFAASPESVSALEFIQSFRNEDIWSTDFENASAEFLKGNTAMLMVPSWRLRDILSFNQSQNLGIDIGISQVPQIPGQDQALYNWATYWSYMVNGSRPNSAASWQFITWLSEPEQQRQLNQNIEDSEGFFGHLYPRKDMASELADDEYLNIYVDSLPFAESFYQVKGADVEEELEKLVDGSSASESSISSVQSTIREFIANRGTLTSQ